jgi:hypothetical protein
MRRRTLPGLTPAEVAERRDFARYIAQNAGIGLPDATDPELRAAAERCRDDKVLCTPARMILEALSVG